MIDFDCVKNAEIYKHSQDFFHKTEMRIEFLFTLQIICCVFYIIYLSSQ